MPIISYTRLSTSFPPSIHMVAVSPMKLEIHVHALLKLRSLDKNEINRQRSKGRPSSSVVFLCRLAYADHLPSQLCLLFPQQSMLFGASYRALCHPKIMGGSAVS
ncbi:hypothetical protein PCH_Pc22g14990 [Penicillium rubens Wisconsin 54-1255]|uniref:Uncharacterized protein n=1 Tax=Penicillium rubens (strain ATCC 28089 / DSM 1075 / NRRL 1951 / Wisconsin 54-1255) TaxID=500485 RepID=B6HVL8_PENRW|nr:hypothetical protein PCH_Pc22g14990 [Penicillium rubens Wisconsin 54-1255]